MRKLVIVLFLFAATASASIFLNSFNSGELDEEMKYRFDIDKTAMGSEELENILIRPQGMAYKRPGTEYIDTVRNEIVIAEVLGDYPTLRAADDQDDPGLAHTTAISDFDDLEDIMAPRECSVSASGDGGFIVITSEAHGFSLTGGQDFQLIDNDAMATTAYYNYGPYQITSVDSPTQITCSRAGYIFNVYRNDEASAVCWQGTDIIGNYYLTANIDASITQDLSYLNGLGWLPIGCAHSAYYFNGTFDGCGYKISGLYTSPDIEEACYSRAHCGLFRNLGSSSVVANLTIEDANMACSGGGLLATSCYGEIYNCSSSGIIKKHWKEGYGLYHIGGLVGYTSGVSAAIYDSDSSATVDAKNYHSVTSNFYGTGGFIGLAAGGNIYNCYATGNVIAECAGSNYARNIGGFAGAITSIYVYDSYATGDVEGDARAGGFVGLNTGRCYRCYATGDVLISYDYVGGFVGYNNNGRFYDCYAWGSAESQHESWGRVGGFAGYGSSYYYRCYSIGEVTGVYQVGGFIGGPVEYSVNQCYWDTETSGTETSIAGGEGKTTTEMKRQTTYETWDFDTVWYMDYTAEGTQVLLGDVRLIPFEYSVSDTYVLEFGHEYIGFLRTVQ